ncbi:MAG: PaaI family thioesterase [Myxococcota bacterium]
MIRMDAAAIEAFLSEHFPQAIGFVRIEDVADNRVHVRLPIGEQHLRPGGTVSGPSLMTLADTAMYFLVLAHVGPVALAVTTHLSMDFLRRPQPEVDVLGTADLLKLGRRLAVGTVTLRSEGDPAPVAHASVTYALPPEGRGGVTP